MTALATMRMTVNEYLAWAESQTGRYELVNGTVHKMSPETSRHAAIKLALHLSLVSEIRARGLPCHVLPDGMTVRVDEATAFEPDALVYCGELLAWSAIEVPNPLIIAEVMSRTTRHIDLSFKLAGYFRLPSLVHYLIVDPVQPLVIHHARQNNQLIETRLVREGAVVLDPPGFELALDDIYGAALP